MENVRAAITALSASPSAEVDSIFTNLRLRKLAKGDFLLKSGQICTQYYFIEQGSVRLFYRKEEIDYTVWIGSPGEIFTNLESYLGGSKSRINIQAMESSQVYVINKSASDALAAQSIAYGTVLRKTVELAFVQLSKNVISFQSEKAAERYERVEKEKNWLTKYPLKYISTFIGVTQSSLSRIRAKKK
ncbi:MAG: Crp/Fnr family transcriptional regulator [Bacteroidota bacterium]